MKQVHLGVTRQTIKELQGAGRQGVDGKQADLGRQQIACAVKRRHGGFLQAHRVVRILGHQRAPQGALPVIDERAGDLTGVPGLDPIRAEQHVLLKQVRLLGGQLEPFEGLRAALFRAPVAGHLGKARVGAQRVAGQQAVDAPGQGFALVGRFQRHALASQHPAHQLPDKHPRHREQGVHAQPLGTGQRHADPMLHPLALDDHGVR